jgi:hypothetical protein
MMGRLGIRRSTVVALLLGGIVGFGSADPSAADPSLGLERTVLVEVFTFLTEPFSPAARDGAQQLLDVYGSENVTWLDWHPVGPFSTPDGAARGALYGVGAYPHVWFDGIDDVLGAFGDMFAVYEPIYLDHKANLPSGAFLESTLTIDPPSTSAVLTITVVPVAPPPDPNEFRILAALYENVEYEGDLWRHLAREIVVDLPYAEGTTTHSVELVASTLPPSGPPEGWGAVVWIQRESDRTVLNASQAAVIGPVGVEPQSWGRIRASYRNP